MIFAGVDIGSTTTKCILLDADGQDLSYTRIDTTFNRNESGEKALALSLAEIGSNPDHLAGVVSTGYGRKAYERADRDIPEIVAHALGTVAVVPEVRTIIDIGGQDSKVIEIDENGNIARFEMNDKCAAGTGRFFEVLSHRLLSVELSDLSDLILQADEPCPISSMCTIFAESEIISYLSQGISQANIAAGLSQSIVRRIIGMGKAGQISFRDKVVFSGGVALNAGVTEHFSQALNLPVYAVPRPQATAARGAAITAMKDYLKRTT